MLTKQRTFGIGLMSGTSLDGVDMVYVCFEETDSGVGYDIIHGKTMPYDETWQTRLQQAYYTDAASLSKLHVDYGFYLGDLVRSFITENRIKTLDFIASHGHTVFHQPKERYTLQIGHGAAIAQSSGHVVVCDFRAQDVIRGGEGAPLVPLGDAYLFSDYDYCLNIGGFANYSYAEKGVRLAKDLCPANILLNHYTRQQGLPYDDGGRLAREGRINTELLQALNTSDFYKNTMSMAYEHIEAYFLPLIEQYDLALEDALRTLVEHIAGIIARALKPNASVLTTGGGAYNAFLIERLQQLSGADIILPSPVLIDYKEALIFALLGWLRLQNRVNILSSVTHVNEDHSSGLVYYP